MTTPRDHDAAIAAFFEERQPELSDRALEAIRRSVHQTRQRGAIRRLTVPDSSLSVQLLAGAAIAVAVLVAVMNLQPGHGPGGAPTPVPTPSPTPTAAPSPSPSPTGPTVFTSSFYGYTMTIPAGWTVVPAGLRWDGTSEPGPFAQADIFVGPDQRTMWAFAGPFDGDLEAFVQARIATTHREHADTCPDETPEIQQPTEVAGVAAVLLGWNCGGVINEVVFVRSGEAFEFVIRDLSVVAASDPDVDALFASVLATVELPEPPAAP